MGNELYLICAYAYLMPGLSSYDQYLLNRFIPQLSGYELFFYLLTQLGSPLTLTVMSAMAIIFGKNKLKAFGAVLLIGMLIAIPVIDDVKDIVKRPRPESAIYYYPVTNNGYSFPSGHAISTFLAATVLGAYFGWKFYASGYLMAIAISLSRLYLGVHYPSDIAAGAIIGIIMGELLVYVAYRLGLCDNAGLISLFYRPAAPTKRTSYISFTGSIGKSGTMALVTVVTMAIVISVIFYYLGHRALVLIFIILASLLILYNMLRDKGSSPKAFMLFILLSSTVISVYSLFFLGAYILSLLALAISYVLTIALTHPAKIP